MSRFVPSCCGALHSPHTSHKQSHHGFVQDALSDDASLFPLSATVNEGSRCFVIAGMFTASFV